MEGRFLSSEEPAMHFPLKTSPHHQLARNLFLSASFCLPTNFPYALLPGTWGWMLVCQQRVMVHAWAGKEKRQGEPQAGISAQPHSAICFGCFMRLTAHRSWEPGATVCLRCISSCFAPLGQQKAFWVCQLIFLDFCSSALDRAEGERSPLFCRGRAALGGSGGSRSRGCSPAPPKHRPRLLPAGNFQ